MKVSIVGPNLDRRESPDGTQQHVHVAGCADLRKRYRQPVDAWTIDVESKVEVVMEVYPPDQFDYDPATELSGYAGDIRFFPCVKDLPEGSVS